MDPHRNVFFYYGGPRHAGADRSRQIEDNTTKAVINTLELSSRQDGPEPLLAPFLQLAGVGVGNVGSGNCTDLSFALQRARIPSNAIRRARRRLLLGIAPRLPTDVGEATDDTGGARPDAWIWGPGFVLCIENKVVGTFDRQPLNRHRKLLGPRPVERLLTWTEVYGFFEDWLRDGRKDRHPVTRALVAEFVGYLDTIAYLQGIAMGTFKGFKQEHFDAFVIEDPATDEDNRKAVQYQLGLFAEAVRKDLPKKLSALSVIHRGNIWQGARSAWVTLSQTETPVHEPHFSFTIGPESMAIRLLMEGKKPSLAAMCAIERDPDGFLAAPEGLGTQVVPGYAVELWHRWQLRVRHYQAAPVCRFHVKYATRTDVDYLLDKMRAIRSRQSQTNAGGLFEVHITRSFPRDDRELADDGFVNVAVETVKRQVTVAAVIL